MPELNLVDGLFQLSFLLQDRLARIGAAHDLSPIQVRLLGILRDRQPAMNKLAVYLDLEKSSLSGLVDRAEKRGLVERVPSSEDRRAATIRLTTQGRKLTRALAEQVGAEVGSLCKPLSATDRKQLVALVARVVESHASDELTARP